MTCIASAPVSRRRAVAPPLQAALAWQAAASNSGVASRPVLFSKAGADLTVACTHDYMGRRATKVVTENGVITTSHRFLYRGYLQIACYDRTRSAHPSLWLITWDPTLPVATRPLAIQKDGTWYSYGWDLTKNIWEAYTTTGYIGTAYTYTAYGQVIASGAIEQPIQWSSEYNDTELALVYYNYRHYNPIDGRWNQREQLGEIVGLNIHVFVDNIPCLHTDYAGLFIDTIWDVGNMIWDVGTIAVGAVTGDSNMVEEGAEDLAFDTIAAIIPGLPAGTSKLLKVTSKVEKVSKKTRKKTLPKGSTGKYVCTAKGGMIPITENVCCSGTISGIGIDSDKRKAVILAKMMQTRKFREAVKANISMSYV